MFLRNSLIHNYWFNAMLCPEREDDSGHQASYGLR